MLIENRPFDTLKIGDSAELTRACTAEALLIFASATGNHNPVHLPDEDGDGRPEAVLGNLLPGPGTLYRSQTLTFHRSARIALAAADCGADLSGIEVVEAKGEAAAQAVRKGNLHTEALLHPMLERARPADRATNHPCFRDGRAGVGDQGGNRAERDRSGYFAGYLAAPGGGLVGGGGGPSGDPLVHRRRAAVRTVGGVGVIGSGEPITPTPGRVFAPM